MSFIGWLFGAERHEHPSGESVEDRVGVINDGVQIVRSAVNLIESAVEDALDALQGD